MMNLILRMTSLNYMLNEELAFGFWKLILGLEYLSNVNVDKNTIFYRSLEIFITWKVLLWS